MKSKNREICKMAGIEKYYEITEVYAWQWEGNTNITIDTQNENHTT